LYPSLLRAFTAPIIEKAGDPGNHKLLHNNVAIHDPVCFSVCWLIAIIRNVISHYFSRSMILYALVFVGLLR